MLPKLSYLDLVWNQGSQNHAQYRENRENADSIPSEIEVNESSVGRRQRRPQ